MKVFNAFAHLFAILAFLTLGSLLMIIAFHILSAEDAALQLRELYGSPWRSLQIGFLGLVFITVGLTFTRMLVKKNREPEALIFQSEMGPIVVSVMAIEDVAKKVLKHFHLVKDYKIKTLIQGKNVEIKLRLVLWSGARIQELLSEIQDEIRSRVMKLLGVENRLEIACDVLRIEDHEADLPHLDSNHEAVSM